ncbi:hypothetical protein C8R47DRAFT_1323638 [Mycena vitilis]|nr:hypothetical protein C8R47DRAFT_1323638 [Mycena vitilis]
MVLDNLDTIYGNQDKKDDLKIGLGSTALLFKIAGVLNGVNAPYSPYHLIGVGGSIFHLGHQFLNLDLDSPASCWAAFSDNGFVVGPTVAIGLLADYLLVDVL